MNALPHTKPAPKAGGLDGRMLALLIPFILFTSWSFNHRFDKIASAEGEMKQLEQRIKDEFAALYDDERMLKRLTGERQKRLEDVIVRELQRIDAWQTKRRDLEVTIREWKAEQRALEGKQP
jgi:hypothetical protein